MTLLPDLDGLRLLADLARLGSIGAAGREAGISQQSASERIRAMETRTGLVLIRRTPSGSSLTPQGRLLVEWSRGLLETAEEIEGALHTLREERRGEIHVHASMTTAEHLVPRWLVQLRRERDVSASLVATNSDSVVEAVRSAVADIGFIEGPLTESGLAHRVIGGDQLQLVAAPGDPWVARRAPLTPEVISARRLTSRESGSGTRHTVDLAFAAAGSPAPRPEVELTSTTAVLAAVRAGSAPAFVSDLAAGPDLASGQLRALVTPGLDLRRDFTAIWVGSNRPPAGPVRDLLAVAAR